MAGALTQAINFPSSVAGSETQKTFTLTINGQINRPKNTKNSVKMAFSTVNAPAIIMRNFSRLRVSNVLDRALKPEIDFHSRIASKIYFRRAKPTRLAPKAVISQGRSQESKMPKAGEHVTNFVKFAEEITQMTRGKNKANGESRVSTLAEYGTDLVKVLAEEVIQIVGENINNKAVGVGGGSGQSKMPTLKKCGAKLITHANKQDPLIGRGEIEVHRVIEILDRHTKNNPWLIGEPGVGKTTIVEIVGEMIADNEVPKKLIGKKVRRLDMSQLVDGTKSCEKLMNEIRQSDNIILFIDELQTSVGAGAAEGTIDAKNILKLALARGELQCIVATTPGEYKKHIENDPALERQFQTVEVLEPPIVEEAVKVRKPIGEETIQILRGVREVYEYYQDVRYTDDALVAAAKLSEQCICGWNPQWFLPDKAKGLIQEAGELVRFRVLQLPDKAKDLEEEKRRVIREKNEAISSGHSRKAAILYIRELDLQSRITAINRKCREMFLCKGVPTVTVADIGIVVSSRTGIPVEKVIGEEKEAVDADGGEGSGESKMPNLAECVVIDLMNIIEKEVHRTIEEKNEALVPDDIGESLLT